VTAAATATRRARRLGAALTAVLIAACGSRSGVVDDTPARHDADAGADAGADAAPDATVCACASDAECDDGLACTSAERCVDCTCLPGGPVSCADGLDCTVDACSEDTRGCTFVPDHARCPPGQLCDPARGGCVAIPCASAAECDDGVFCNGTETCPAGFCVQGPEPTCDDGVSCTTDRCDAGRDACAAEPRDAACDDRVFCNGTESCDAVRGCVGGTAPDCVDALACSADACDLGQDECAHTPPDADGDGHGDQACGRLGDDCDDGAASIHPGAAEVCDGLDQDCDGTVDDGVLSECGDCRVCFEVDFPTEQQWTEDASASDGVAVDPDGSIVLDSSSTETYFAWIANTLEGTVSKLDTRTGEEVSVYASVSSAFDHGGPGADGECREGEGQGNTGNCPSRTAVDLRGNVFVANRAFDQQGTVSKIANFEEDCIDRDGDGVIDTSRDVDGDGRIDRGDAAELVGETDECILWTVDVGPDGGIPRAVAIDAGGDVWIGLYAAAQFVQLDADDGAVLDTVDLDISPYGAAIGSGGVLWAADACCGQGRIQSIDTNTGRAGDIVDVQSTVGCVGNYGIAVDGNDRVWLGGFPCEAAFRYNPATEAWFTVNLLGEGLGRGIAASEDGRIWMGVSSQDWDTPTGRIVSFRAADGGGVRSYDLPEGIGTVGVGLDSEGHVWGVNRDTSTASRLDPADGSIDEFPVGNGPYTYSDFTGYALRTFTAPSGYHREVVAGCEGGPTTWELVTWDGVLPANTRIELSARTAETRDALSAVPFVGTWTDSPAELGDPPGPVGTGHFLELEVVLFSDGGNASPVLSGLSVRAVCE